MWHTQARETLIQNRVAVMYMLETLQFSSSGDGNSVQPPEVAWGKVFWGGLALAVRTLGKRVVLHHCSVSCCVCAAHRRVHVTVGW